MYLKRFYDEDLAQASYLVACQAASEAIVIDPSRHVEQYIKEAEAQKVKIVAVTETHIHADYLSGSRQLAEQVGAKMYLSKEGGPDWQYQFAGPGDSFVGDKDVIKLGNLSLEVMHTPGHTPESISFILTDHPASDEPIGVFTGDFLFVGDVGRPDLLEKAAGIRDTMRKGAAQLFHTLRRFEKLPDYLQIWPAHGAGSACGKALGAIPSSVLGYEKKTNWAFQISGEQEFVEAILEGQPEPPKYFAQMKKLNKIGPPLLTHDKLPELSAASMEGVLKEGKLIDLRGVDEFVQGHPEGALFLPEGSSLVTWAGWLLSYQEDLHFLVKDAHQAERAARSLRSIGLDNVKGYYLENAVKASGLALRASKRIEASDVDVEAGKILDVRSEKEWSEGHLEGALHIHLGYLQERLDEVPDQPVVYCGSGVRSLIASSLLQRAGKQPIDIVGGWEALKGRKEAVKT